MRMRIFLLLSSWVIAAQLVAQPTAPDRSLVVEYSEEGGFYDEPFYLKIYGPEAAEVYYTLDGSTPTRSATRYTAAIHLDSTRMVRAVAYREGKRSHVYAQSYFVGEPATDFPVVSIGIDPWRLFDLEKGLFVKGPNADTTAALVGANFWDRREHLMSCQMFESDGQPFYNSTAGFRLFGGMSRLFPQKSIAVVSRKRYGQKRIKHRIFPELDVNKFKFLVLRNSGSDWGKTHFRDALMTGLVSDWNIETQAYRPALLYINGQYWGIYNIREKVNTYYLDSHHDVDQDSIDLIEHQSSLKKGRRRHYLNMLSFLEETGVRTPEAYTYIQSQMDVDNFIDLQVAQIFFDNQDAGGNIKFWRPQRPDGKWRWILYDTDWGFGLHDKYAYRVNGLEFHTKPDGTAWPNPAWSTLILRKLLENEEFKRTFINRFCDRLNTTLLPEHIDRAITDKYEALLPEMPRHLARWRLSERRWQDQVTRLRTFGEKRPGYMWQHLQDYFELGRRAPLQLVAEGRGRIILNDNIVVDTIFTGTYFADVPVTLRAEPVFGYQFSHWEGIVGENRTPELVVPLSRVRGSVRAVFKQSTHRMEDLIVFNEVCANHKKAGDWVELYNRSEQPINLRDWIFSDGQKSFRLPDYFLPADSYVVLCQNRKAYVAQYGDGTHLIGDFDFGLNKVEDQLHLYSAEGAAIDRFDYRVAPRDTLFTLELLAPTLDNSDQENWKVHVSAGTPGAPNPTFAAGQLAAAKSFYLKLGGGIALVLLGGMIWWFYKRA